VQRSYDKLVAHKLQVLSVNYPTARSRGLALAQQAGQGFGAG